MPSPEVLSQRAFCEDLKHVYVIILCCRVIHASKTSRALDLFCWYENFVNAPYILRVCRMREEEPDSPREELFHFAVEFELFLSLSPQRRDLRGLLPFQGSRLGRQKSALRLYVDQY